MDKIKDIIQQDGFPIVQHFFTDKYIDEIIEQLDRHNALEYDKQIVSDFNLLNSIPFVKSLVHSRQLISLVKQMLGDNSFPINAFVIDKTQSFGIPLLNVRVTEGTNNEYEKQMETVLLKAKAEGINNVIFGDIFLEDLRAYRENN